MNIMAMVFRWLSSKESVIWLLGGWIIYYVSFAIWQKEAFGGFIIALSSNPVVIALYLIFLVSVYLNLYRVVNSRWNQGRLYTVLSLVFYLGAALLFTGIFTSTNFRQHEWSEFLGEGDVFAPRWSNKQLKIEHVKPVLKSDTLESEANDTIFEYEPQINVIDKSGLTYTIVAFPPTRISGNYYHILNFGLGPGIRLSRDGNVVVEGYLALRILPPGTQDSFEVPTTDYRSVIRIAPTRIVKRGDANLKLYDLKELQYEVSIYRGDKLVFEGNSRDGIEFDGYTMSFFEPSYWVVVEMVKDGGVILIISGILLILLGIPLGIVSLLFKKGE